MLPEIRHAEILQSLEHQGAVRVSEIASRLGVTQETIRRDLVKLEEEGKVQRTHGGALPRETSHGPHPYQQRQLVEVEAKRSIARLAMQEFSEEDVVFLDGSTTCFQFARIFPDIPCTVLTNSEPIFRELSSRNHVELVSTGGVYDRRHACFVGPLAEQMLSTLHVTKAFMGCKGVDFERGFSDAAVRHMNLKRAMARTADEVILLVDHTKMDTRSRYYFAKLDEVDLVLSDPGLSEAHRKGLRAQGVAIRTE
jgi:DeoR/GlpR family transcriptional regulator of sugar metabolism